MILHPRSVLGLGTVRGQEKTIVQREGKPHLRLKLCAEGKIPVSKTPAKPTVAAAKELTRRLEQTIAGPA